MIFLLQITILVILIIAALVLYEFVRTKNGTLRKIMIAYFICELWKNIIGLMLISFYGDLLPFPALCIILAMIIPKAVVKMRLWLWQVKN